ncbi:Na+/H+ antiporter subunit E [Ancrocorticia populi]|uniref:Na+/H+ antiporter subunit E n=1 Tax=Ancrocorticia populi TaxID=2175228 RepID=A0A2V1KB34_9ACTO|nr:Na+/H+ antiporter subunit E [Ancrocorticia populi]PWF26161.1 Na+/H+ antiporter subunit E [Ancrocorticia populi]
MSRSSDAIRVATQRPGRFPHASLGTLLWCTVVWVMLWGEVTPGNIISGFVLALAITSLAPFPAMRFDGRFRPRALVILATHFLYDLVVSSTQQAFFIIRRKKPRAAIIRVQLRSESDMYLTMTAGMSAVVPGTVPVEADAATGTLYIHVFDIGLAGGVSAAHAAILDLEERILRTFASRDELIRAGLVPGPTKKSGLLPMPFAPVYEPEEED